MNILLAVVLVSVVLLALDLLTAPKHLPEKVSRVKLKEAGKA